MDERWRRSGNVHGTGGKRRCRKVEGALDGLADDGYGLQLTERVSVDSGRTKGRATQASRPSPGVL